MTRRYGAGTVYQRPDGKWSGQWSAGRDAQGRRIRGTITADTEAAAWKALRARSSSSTPRRGGESVGDFLQRWLDDVVRKDRRERTYWGYRSIVDGWLMGAFGDRPLRSLTRHEVQAWVDHHPRSPLTIRHHIDCLRSAMGYAVRWGLITDNPAKGLDLPTYERRVVDGIDETVAHRWLEAVKGTWIEPMVVLSLYTGLRQGELLGLRWEDVNLGTNDHGGRPAVLGGVAKGQPARDAEVLPGLRDDVRRPDRAAGYGASLHVRHSLTRLPGRGKSMRYALTPPKSAKSRRMVPLLPEAVQILRAEQRRQMAGEGNWKGLVFGHHDGPIDGTGLTHHFQAALAHAGLTPVRWHDLRHAWVSILIASGVDLATISNLAGHSGISITVDTYGHLADGLKREAMGRFGEKMARRVG